MIIVIKIMAATTVAAKQKPNVFALVMRLHTFGSQWLLLIRSHWRLLFASFYLHHFGLAKPQSLQCACEKQSECCWHQHVYHWHFDFHSVFHPSFLCLVVSLFAHLVWIMSLSIKIPWLCSIFYISSLLLREHHQNISICTFSWMTCTAWKKNKSK